MKNKITLLVASLLLCIGVFAQAPQKINYQAVARDISGVPMISSPLTVIFDVRSGSSSGTVVYSETHTPTTNQFGLFTSAIGGGTANAPFTTASFAGINWGSNMYFLQVTVNGDVMPSTQLLSVPYALHANTASSGTPGVDGLNCWDLNGNGVQDAAEDINGDLSWDALDCKGDSGVAGANGTNGIGINWLGTLTNNPVLPGLNDAYYNSVNGISYIWDGSAWQTLAQDGSSTGLTAGTGIDITTGTISNTGDLDSTNELITSAILNGTTLEITEDGVLHTVSLASLAGADNWGSDTVNISGTNISGSGTVANPLMVIDNDTSKTNELQTLAFNSSDSNIIEITNGNGISLSSNTPSTNQVLTWDGANWVAQNPGSGADNWGSQVVQTSGANITGDGTIGAPLTVTEVDGSVTNEIQDLSNSGNTINITGGTGADISAVAPSTGDYLYWNGLNWVSQPVPAGSDNQDLTLTGNSLSVTNDPTPVDLSPYLDNTDAQTLNYVSASQSLSISNGNAVTLVVDDADANPTNEIQQLSFTTPNLSISGTGGNTVDLSTLISNDGDWNINGVHIENANSGNVGIGPMHTSIGGPGYFLSSGKALTIATANNYSTTPPAALELVGTSATGTDIMGRVAFGYVVNAPTLPTYLGGIEMDKIGDMMFSTNGANERLRINSSGNVGIGTSTPFSTFDVNGLITMRTGATNGYIPVSNNNGTMTWTNPLTITTADDGDWIRYFNGTYNYLLNDNTHYTRVLSPSTTSAFLYSNNNIFEIYASGGDRAMIVDATYMELGDVDGGQFGNKLIIDPEFNGNFQFLGGNVGIGTASPLFPLEVNTSTEDRNVYIINSTTSAGGKYGVYSGASGGGTGDNNGGWFDASGNATGINTGVGGQALGTAGENRAVYGSAINGTTNWAGYFDQGDVYIANSLGIGTTTPGAGLEVVSGGAVNASSDGLFNVGANNTSHLTMDGNEIQGRSSTGTSTLYLNYWGSDVLMAYQDGSEVAVGGNSSSSVKLYSLTSTNTYAMYGNNSQATGGYGMRAYATSSSGNTWGIYAATAGTSTNTTYGVYGLANASGTNWAIYSSGNSWAAGGTWGASDERLKKNISSFDGALDKIAQLPIKTYYFDTKKHPTMGFSNRKQYGIMAQDLEGVFPEMVLTSKHNIPAEDGEITDEMLEIKAVNYDQLIPVLIKGMQEQQEEIEELKKELEELKNNQ